MNVVVWARVFSKDQRDGYSLDAQLRVTRNKAQREGWKIVREFVVAESAKRGAERQIFNEMYRWVKSNARREKINVILSHKLDRVCRNMRDAVRLQELEDVCGVKLAFVDNQFGPGAAGALSFNVMAAVAQYYSDNLRAEVLKGMDERVRQGLPLGSASYGYMYDKQDENEPVKLHPQHSVTVVRIFELYATGSYTFKTLADTLAKEGHVYHKNRPRFHRTALSYILNNRFYLGELVRHGNTYPGKFKPLIHRQLFQMCQDLLTGKNRRTGKPIIPYGGGLFRCAYCGRAMVGEKIRRRYRNGRVNEYIYYKCANNGMPDHPINRWKQKALEAAIEKDLATLVIQPEHIMTWLRDSIRIAFFDVTARHAGQRKSLAKRLSELKQMQDRLLNAFLADTIDEAIYKTKSLQLTAEQDQIDAAVREAETLAHSGEHALQTFDLSRKLIETWSGLNISQRRKLLDLMSSYRVLSATTIEITKRPPFSILAEWPKGWPDIAKSMRLGNSCRRFIHMFPLTGRSCKCRYSRKARVPRR